jgi:hypothetical protein
METTPYFTTEANTLDGKTTLRDPGVSVCWEDERPPSSFVPSAATATTSSDSADPLYWDARFAGRYAGSDLAEVL